MAEYVPDYTAEGRHSADEFTILDSKRQTRESILEGTGFSDLVEAVAEENDVISHDIISEMRNLVRNAPEGAPFARPDVKDGPGDPIKAALIVLTNLENIGIDFDAHSCKPRSFDISLDREPVSISRAEGFVNAHHNSQSRIKGPWRESPFVRVAANNAFFMLNTQLNTVKEIDLINVEGDVFVAPLPVVSAFSTNFDGLRHAQYARVQVNVIMVAAGPGSYLDREGTDALDQIETTSVLDEIKAPRRKEDPGSAPNRHPTTGFGYSGVPVVDQGYENFETDKVYIVRLDKPAYYIIDKMTTPILNQTNGMWMPVVHMWSFQRWQMTMDSIDLNIARATADPTQNDPSEGLIAMARNEANKFLAPFGFMYHIVDVDRHGLEHLKILRKHFAYEMEMVAKGEITNEDEEDLLWHFASLQGDKRLWVTQSPDVIAAEERALASDSAEERAKTPAQEAGFFCAQSRTKVFAALVRKEKEAGRDLSLLSPVDFGNALLYLEANDPIIHEKHAIHAKVLTETASIASLVYPVMRAFESNTVAIKTTSQVPMSELRDDAEARLNRHTTRIFINPSGDEGGRDDMAFTYEAGQYIDLNDISKSRLDAPSTEESEDVDGVEEGEDPRETEVKRVLALAKKMRIPPELLKAVVLGDSDAIDRLVEAQQRTLGTETMTEAIQSKAVALRQENALIAQSDENLALFLADPHATDMRMVSRNPNMGIKMLDVMGMKGGLAQVVALSPANAEETIRLMCQPLQPDQDTYLAATAKVSKVHMFPAVVGVATRKALQALGQSSQLLDHTTFSNFGQIGKGESPTALSIAFQRDLQKVPGNLTHSQLGLQIISIMTAAALAVGKACPSRGDVNERGWIDFVFGREYQVLPYLLHEDPLGAVGYSNDKPVSRLRDGCPYVSDMLILDGGKRQWLHDGSVIYMIRARGDHSTACLFNTSSGLNLLFGHFPGGRFFYTGYGSKATLVEWEGLRDAIFAPVEEDTGDMFSTVISSEDGTPRLSNPFHLEVSTLCDLFGWTTGVPAAITDAAEESTQPDDEQ